MLERSGSEPGFGGGGMGATKGGSAVMIGEEEETGTQESTCSC
jgi:hypothetical protein